MTERDDGGPAYGHGNPTDGGYPGMSLRDAFAMAALTGLLHADELARAQVNPGGRYTTAPEFAGASYELADAMLKARKP